MKVENHIGQVVLTPHQQNVYNEWNNNRKHYPAGLTIHELFEEQVKRTPDRPALAYGNRSICYQELNERANQLAHYLHKTYALRAGQIVVLCLDGAEYLLTGMLAVLKTGAAYVNINPGFTDEQLYQILHDTAAKIVLTTSEDIKQELAKHTPVELINQLSFAKYSTENIPTTSRPYDLAYVMYSSDDKGILIEHRNLVNFAYHQSCLIREDDKIACYHYHFTSDAINAAIYPALLKGSCVYMIDLAEKEISEHQITVLVLPTAAAAGLMSHHPSLRMLITKGGFAEPLALPGITHLQLYGPAATTVCATFAIDGNHHRPFANVTTYILDATLQQVPEGELYIGGSGIARGYLNEPALTAAHFIDNPFVTDEEAMFGINARLYKTGRLARYLSDGSIEQVKPV